MPLIKSNDFYEYIVDDLEKRFHTLNDDESRKKSRRKQKIVICSLKDERGSKTITKCVLI